MSTSSNRFPPLLPDVMTNLRTLPSFAIPAVLLGSFLAACASTDEAEPDTGPTTGGDEPGPISVPEIVDEDWSLTVAFAGDVRINGVATGELDPETPGDEIVTVDQRGRLRILRRAGDGFEEMDLGEITATGDGLETQGSANAPTGELVQVICADLVPRIPGDEIIAVGVLAGGEDDGGRGLVRVFARAGVDRTWVEYRHVTPALVHAVTAGDILPNRPGAEFVIAGFFGQAHVGRLDTLRGQPSLVVEERPGLTHQGNAKGACLTRSGLVLACDNGFLYTYTRAADGAWFAHDGIDVGGGLARVTAYPGGGVAVCGNDGTFRVVRYDRAAGTKSTWFLVRAENRLRGAVIADLDPAHPGDEAATAGYDGIIRLVRFFPGEGASDAEMATSDVILARDTAKLHHLTTGTFEGLGLSLVSCGYSGDVLVVSRTGSDG